MQVLTGFNHGGMETITPIGTRAGLTPIVGLPKFPGDLLHEFTDRVEVLREGQQMHVITGQAIIQNRQIIPADGLPQSTAVIISISGKPQEELPVVATMGQMIDIAGNEISIGSGHK